MRTNSVASLLTTCEREPINTPGAIQGYGVLIALSEPDMRVKAVSDNVASLLGCSPKALLNKPVAPFLGRAQLNRVIRYVDQQMWSSLQPITLSIRRRRRGHKPTKKRWDLFVHRYDETLIMEFEPAVSAATTLPYYRRLRAAFGRIHASRTGAELCQYAAEVVRTLTNFDRVMVYRFDEDWNGEVTAEAKRDDLTPYLHHHFPASDIPSQARAAFLSTWVRMIPDVHYKPVPVRCIGGDPPLDMARGLLRSVSPVHIEYLKNMGTGATLTITLKTAAGLWGLIACHHETPMNLFHEARLACELIGKTVSSLLLSRQQQEEEHHKDQLRQARTELAARMDECGSVRDGLWNNPELLLRVVDAEGVAARVDAGKNWMLIGKTPPRQSLAALARWLSDKMGETEVFSTHNLARCYPRAKSFSQAASGLLAVSIPKAEHNFIMWFRPEEAVTKVWAGDPHKHVSKLPDGTIKIEPRHSFDDWKEQVRLRSRPWTEVDCSSAMAMRANLMATDLRQQFEMAQRAVRVRDDFLSIASHELKTPLTSMRLQSQLARRRMQDKTVLEGSDLQRVTTAARKVDEGMERLIRLIDDMLDISRINTGKLVIRREDDEIVELVHGVIERMRVQFEAAEVPLHVRFGEKAAGHWDRLRIEQVIWNLLSNALRYGHRSPVYVEAGAQKEQAVITVRDKGPGIRTEDQATIFQKFKRADGQQEQFGLGLGLHICKHIVERHGGSIEVQSAVGEGSTFRITLPLRDEGASDATGDEAGSDAHAHH